MDHQNVLDLIEKIAATSSRNEKREVLEELVSSELGKFVLKWTYDPFVTYGLTPDPVESANSTNIAFRPNLIEPLLRRLAKRELTGRAAEREVADVMAALDASGARLLYLILSKDLKCGIAEATINEVMPNLIPVFAVMRAHPLNPKKIKKWPWKAEPKLDGNRNTFICRESLGGFFTRSRKRVPALDFMVQPVIEAATRAYDVTQFAPLKETLSADGSSLNFVLDGEAMMGLFEDTGALRRKNADAVGAELHLYDILSLADFDAVGSAGPTFLERRKILAEFVKQAHLGGLAPENRDLLQIVPQYFVNSEEDIDKTFAWMRQLPLATYLARGNEVREKELLKTTIDEATGKPKVLEGIIVKNPDALYEKKKSYAWMKVKAEETEDLRVIGVFSGQADTKYADQLGGLIVDRLGVEVRVGGGFSDLERAELWELWKKDAALLGVSPDVGFKGQAFAATGLRAAGASTLLTRLVEVEFHEVTPDGSLRHPRFIRFRDDKDGEVELREAA